MRHRFLPIVAFCLVLTSIRGAYANEQSDINRALSIQQSGDNAGAIAEYDKIIPKLLQKVDKVSHNGTEAPYLHFDALGGSSMKQTPPYRKWLLQALFNEAQCNIALGNTAAAIENYSTAMPYDRQLVGYGGTYNFPNLRGQLYEQMGLIAEAESDYLLTNHQKYVALILNDAEQSFRKKAFRDTIKQLNQPISKIKNPELLSKLLFLRAKSYLGLGLKPMALEDLRAAGALDPTLLALPFNADPSSASIPE